MNRRDFLRKGLGMFVGGGLLISGCVKTVVDSQSQVVDPQVQNNYAKILTLYTDTKSEGVSSAYILAPFDKAKDIFNKNGFRIISPEENALLRMQEGNDSLVSKFGNYTRAGFVYVPQRGVFLVKTSPILDDTEKATEANRNGKEFYIDNEQVEKALEDSVQLSYDLEPIPTNRFGDEEITDSTFGDKAKAYGEFLMDAGIKEMPIWLVYRGYMNEQSKPFVRQLWFDDLNCRSALNGDFRYLNDYSIVRGIRKF